MAGFWNRLFGKPNTSGSALTAKERLQFILVHDRLRISPENLTAMKKEILDVISKYVAVSGSDVDIAFKQLDSNSNMLVAEIPFLKTLQPTKPSPNDDSSHRVGSGNQEPVIENDLAASDNDNTA